MLPVPFLTDIDPQAQIKGSRDPLGLQTIWARLGRHVVGNLTTVSTSVRDFTTLVLGYYFAERVANEGAGDGDLAVFLRWEQLAAYARGHVNKDLNFRGVERVKKTLADGDRVRLGIDSAAQILSNQKTYGLWGLYSVPARSSGLVEGDPTRLTAAGKELVEGVYLPIFTKEGLRNADAVMAKLAKPKVDLDLERSDRRLVAAVAKVLAKQLGGAERETYRRHLLLGGPEDKTAGGQAVLAKALESTFDEKEWALSPPRVRYFAKRCGGDGDIGRVVADRLERIRTAELLLAPSAALFGLLLNSDGQTVPELARIVKRQWGASLKTVDLDATVSLETELRDSTGEAETGRRWVKLARVLTAGEFDVAIHLLMEQNAFVMKARAAGGPWVDLHDGKLRVRFRDDNAGELPDKSELPNYWRHSYFIDSLRAIALTLRS
jgi:hypothetical protein